MQQQLKRITYTFAIRLPSYPETATARVIYKPMEGGGYESIVTVNGMEKSRCKVYCEHSAGVSKQLIEGIPELQFPPAPSEGEVNP